MASFQKICKLTKLFVMSSSSIKISHSAFDGSIPTVLTNEIPHVPTYSILNQHLRNTWSYELIGKTYAKYDGTLNSVKMMNGEQSENYFPRYVKFANPEDNQIYKVEIGKIDFVVDGAWETEMDYLMHEQARYLSKLYPDDFLSLFTLTEAERQSYFNEALHMIHSYFDTEQISVGDQLSDLYYRNRFAMGITAARKNTGVSLQEEQLQNLVNTGNLKVYTGYESFVSESGELVNTNKPLLENTSDVTVDRAYSYSNSSQVNVFNTSRVNGKITQNSLKDFFENAKTAVQITGALLGEAFKPFYKIDISQPEDLLDQFISDDLNNVIRVNLNRLFLQATEQGEIRAGSSFVALKKTSFGGLSVVANDKKAYSFVFSDSESTSLQILDTETRAFIQPTVFENAYLINPTTLADMSSAYLLKLGSVSYQEDFLLAVGNWIASQISYFVNSSETFLRNFQSVIGTSEDSLQLMVEVYQDNKRLFAGLLNKTYFQELESLVVGDHYDYQNFSDNFSTNYIFSYILMTKLEECIGMNADSNFKFVFSTIKTNRNDLLAKGAYIGEDSVNYEEPAVVSLIPSQGTSFEVELQLIKTKEVLNSNGEVTKLSEILTYTGSTRTGEVVCGADRKQITNFTIDDELTSGSITINGFTYSFNGTDISTTTKSGKEVKIGERISKGSGGFKYFHPDMLNVVKQKNIGLSRLDEQLLDTSYRLESPYQQNNLYLAENVKELSCLNLNIEWYDTLQHVIQSNYTATVENAVTSANTVIYTTRLVRNQQFKIPADIEFTLSAISKLFFKAQESQNFELATYPCYFYADNVIRIEKDIAKNIATLSRVAGIIVDNFGGKHACTVVKATVKNEYCYLTLEESIPGLSTFANVKGYIVLDYCRVIEKTEDRHELIKDVRKAANKVLYRTNKNYFFLGFDWTELSKENLNWIMDNIYSDDVTVTYADSAAICSYTNVPVSLTELEYTTIVDAEGSESFALAKDLIAENKSLYLDSAVKRLFQVPMSLHNLVHCDKYGTYSYLYSDTPPSYISFYKSDDYMLYQSFSDFLRSKSEELEIQDIQEIYNRRFVIWGDVVWDANNVNKSVATLRTVWGGYFSNFEIYSTDDIIPSEADLLSLSGNKQIVKKNQSILNYNYASNNGTPELEWNIALGFSKNNKGRATVNTVDAFTHKNVKPTESNSTTVFDYRSEVEGTKKLYTDTFSFKANRLDLKSDRLLLTNCKSMLNALDISHLRLCTQVKNDVLASYNVVTGDYIFTLQSDAMPGNYNPGSSYKVKLLYNMLHDKVENFKALNFFNGLNLDTATAMILEYFVFQYVTSQIVGYVEADETTDEMSAFKNLANNGIAFTNRKDLLNYISSIYNGDKLDELEAWKAYKNNPALKDTDAVLELKDVLDYVYESIDFIPAIGVINNENLVEIYYARLIKESENDYLLCTGSLIEYPSGDLLNDLMPIHYKSFQVKASLYSKTIGAVTSYQYTLPEKFKGTFRDLDILYDYDKSPYYETLSNSTAVSKQLVKENIESYNAKNGLLLNIFEGKKGISVDGNTLTFVDGTAFDLTSSNNFFRECYPANLQLATLEPENEGADILRCQIHFDKDYQLANKGYLYLTNLSIPNIRTSYNEKRETQIVERDYLLENLHILAFQQNGDYARFILQDSNKSQTRRILGIADKIKPVDSQLIETWQKQIASLKKENEEGIIDQTSYKTQVAALETKIAEERTRLDLEGQLITDTELNFGFTWVDPGVPIGYTFYKRKFLAEGVIDGVLPTTVRLADEDLNNDDDFDLNNHIAPGDTVQLWILNPTSNYVDGASLSFSLATEDNYVGPYKVIYEKTDSSKADPSQLVILSGPGNLVYVKVGIQSGSIYISHPIVFDSTNTYYAYSLPSGEIVYRDENNAQHSVTVSDVALTVDNFADCEGDMTKVEAVSSSNEIVISASTVALKLSEAFKATLASTHAGWENFDRTGVETDEDYAGNDAEDLIDKDIDAFADDESGLHGESEATITVAPTEIAESISLPNGSINYDNFDRTYFLPSEADSTSAESAEWLANPAETEEFDASGRYETIETSDLIVSIEDADDTTLKTFIRKSLISIFDQTSAAYLIGSGEYDNTGTADDSAGIPVSNSQSFTFSADTHLEVAQVAIARTLFGIPGEGTIDLNLSNIFLPKFQDCDVPVFLKAEEEPKWKKVKLIVGTTGRTLDQASTEELREFAHAINPTDYITRKAPKVTSWIKSGKFIVAWDQTTGTVTVMDKMGNLKGRVAIPTVGYKQPITNQSSINPKAWSLSNRIYAATANTSTAFNEYVKQANARNKVETVFPDKGTVSEGIYEVFEKTSDTEGTLYLPTLFSGLKEKTDAQIKADLKTGNETYFNTDEAQQKGLELIRFALDTKKYEAYRNYCKWLDYLAPDSCEYISFKDTSHTCNNQLLQQVLIALKATNSSEYNAANSVLQELVSEYNDTLTPLPVKGLPYFTENTLSQDSVFKQYLDTSNPVRLTSISATGSTTFAFESLIKTSGFEISGKTAVIYGEIAWPALIADKEADEKLTLDIAKSTRSQIQDYLNKSEHVDQTYREMIADSFANAIEQEIFANYAAFYGEITESNPYMAGAKGFIVKVDLETLQVSNVQSERIAVVENSVEKQVVPTMLTIKASSETLTAVSDKGEMNFSPDSGVLQELADSGVTTGIKRGITQVYDALKSLSTFGTTTFDATGPSLKIQLLGTSIANPDIAYSTVKRVDKKTFELRDDVVLLSEGDVVNAILLVKSTQKDNFQYAYGEVSNLDYVPAAKTLFEVPNYHYADFATYENKASVGGWITETTDGEETQLWRKPSVYDLYPTWEVIDEDLRKHFYKTTSDNKLQYLKNDNGRYIFRLLPVYGEVYGGNYVKADSSVAAGATKIEQSAVLKDSRVYQRSYDYVSKNIMPQKVPALVSNPNAAILDYPYKIEKLALTPDSKTRLRVFDDFLVATVKTKSVTDKLKNAIANSAKSYYLESNKAQACTVLKSQKDFENMSTEALASNTNTKSFYKNGALMPDCYIAAQGIATSESLSSSNIVTVKASIETTVANSSYSATATQSYEGDLRGDWIVLRDNLAISSLDIYIDNRSKTLPRFVPITKYKSSRNANNELILKETTSRELYIPAKGYGQAMLSSYTVPSVCPFQDGVFFQKEKADSKEKLYTRNSKDEAFKLVDKYGDVYKDASKDDVLVPNLVYKSFAAADAVLSKKLPTDKPVEGINTNALINLSNFSDVDIQNIYFENSDNLLNLGFVDGNVNAADDTSATKKEFIYDLFKSGLEISCDLSYSRYSFDASTNRVVAVPAALKSTLGYTRIYEDQISLPVNYSYRTRKGTIETILSGPSRDLDHLLTDVEGKVIYVDLDGNTTSDAAKASPNKPIPAPRISEGINFFEVTGGRILSIIYSCFYLAKRSLQGSYATATISVSDSTQQKTIICACDPNKAATTYSRIQKKNSFVTPDWEDTMQFHWRFPENLQLDLSFSEKTESYNFAYLKDKAGNIVGKIFFEEPLDEDTLLVMSSVM